MAFAPQKITTPPTRVQVDFPALPPSPGLSLPSDMAAMQAYGSALASWYESLKTVTLDKLQALQSEIDTLKKG